MKTIGLIGGTSWQSTIEYYRYINEYTEQVAGKRHSAKIIIHSIDFSELEKLVAKQDFNGIADLIAHAAKSLQDGGADFFMIGANTLHFIAKEVERAVSIPLLHIATATIAVLKEKKVRKAGLLGTKFTMEHPFYKRLYEFEGIELIVPDEQGREYVNSTIFEELFSGNFLEASKKGIIEIMKDLVNKGAEGIVLGCTEIPLLISSSDTSIPLFDTTAIHSRAAVEYALK